MSFQTFFGIILLSIAHATVAAEAKERDRSITWVFNKVLSDEPAVDAKQVKALTAQYENTTIKFNYGDEYGTTMSIDSTCSFRVTYFRGKEATDVLKHNKTLDSYNKLFRLEKLPTNDWLKLFGGDDSPKCAGTFSQFIGIKDYLIIVDNGLYVMFKRLASDANKLLFRDDFPQYCHDPKEGEVYDGTSTTICNYSGMEIKDVYARLKSMIDFDRLSLFQDEMPLKNKKYEVKPSKDHGPTVMSYWWSGLGKLVITKQPDANETFTYTFEKKKTSTRLNIVHETGY